MRRRPILPLYAMTLAKALAVSRASNRRVRDRLRECADILEAQGAAARRVQAFRQAADVVARLPEELFVLLGRMGRPGLEALPGIGPRTAAGIEEMVRTGHWGYLERLLGWSEPEELLRVVPGVGQALAERIHDLLDVDTLEGLELAAHDGRLDDLPAVGAQRATLVRRGLASLLSRPRPGRRAVPEPPVTMLLDVDSEYRRRATSDALPRISPRRFNPSAAAWLPILHTERGPWELTALYANTPRAHRLGTVRDWVLVYFRRGDDPEGHRTVMTETRGPARGWRVVRGREPECLQDLFAPALKAG
jgi:putative hydrolase